LLVELKLFRTVFLGSQRLWFRYAYRPRSYLVLIAVLLRISLSGISINVRNYKYFNIFGGTFWMGGGLKAVGRTP